MDKLERFLTACRNGIPDRPPVWFLRQAGRYLPEYRSLRKKYSFEQILSSPELAGLVSIQPFKRFDLDAIIVFSDILEALRASGVKVNYGNKGVVIENKSINRISLKKGKNYLLKTAEAISCIRKEVGKMCPVIGFAGAPFTLACYLIEGGTKGSRDFMKVRKLIVQQNNHFKKLIDLFTDVVVSSLQIQIEYSANAVMLFDSLAEILTGEEFEMFALSSARNVFHAIGNKNVPKIYYARGCAISVDKLCYGGIDVFSADWRLSMADVKMLTNGKIALQGNLNPALLFADDDIVRSEVRKILKQTGGRGHIFNLGAGIFPDTSPQKVSIVVDEVKKWKNDYADME